MSKIVSFADVAHPIVSFSRDKPEEALVLELIDTPWFQRLRDISQTANTRLVYMFSEHSRFGHSIGVAYLAKLTLEALEEQNRETVAPYKSAILAAALLHDIGHLAPGSHTAYPTWFPTAGDVHEELGCRIVSEDSAILNTLKSSSPTLFATITEILRERDSVPPWTWQVLSGGGWNADRGNWCIVDSVLAGVNYGQYNIPALIGSLRITNDGSLAIRENRLDALMHFAISRHAMYRQLYQHRTLMAADMLTAAIAKRARILQDALPFADHTMRQVLEATSPLELPLESLFAMREAWWRYHLIRWLEAEDPILRDLSERLVNRRLLKTVRVLPDEDGKKLWREARDAVERSGYDPDYYLHRFRLTHMHRGDSRQALAVQQESGKLIELGQAEPLFEQLVQETDAPEREWIAIPAEAKALLGRER
ncbi:MAG: HD domain-containing protein [Bdellovibrionales bacterium]|nr:HD domain-containing protein [Bdellovibrionales bacterium]